MQNSHWYIVHILVSALYNIQVLVMSLNPKETYFLDLHRRPKRAFYLNAIFIIKNIVEIQTLKARHKCIITVAWSDYINLNHLLNPIWPTILRDVFIFKNHQKVKLWIIHPSHKFHNAQDKKPTMHHFQTYFCCKMVHCGIWVWCIVGFVQWVYWLTKILFWVNKSELLGIKRPWIKKT